MNSPYDSFAWFYNRYWGEPFQAWQAPILDRLLPGPCPILDLCCGAGHLARRLAARGYQVVGLDSSAEMLRHARDNAPAAHFFQSDASRFRLSEPVDAATCTFDSLNHMLEEAQVAEALRCVHDSLNPGGAFVCDINTDAAYGPEWDKSACRVEADHAFFLRGHYDSSSRLGSTGITMFRFGELWERFDVEIPQRPWTVDEMKQLLRSAGFDSIDHFSPLEDLGIAGHFGQGRVYFRSCRNSVMPAS